MYFDSTSKKKSSNISGPETWSLRCKAFLGSWKSRVKWDVFQDALNPTVSEVEAQGAQNHRCLKEAESVRSWVSSLPYLREAAVGVSCRDHSRMSAVVIAVRSASTSWRLLWLLRSGPELLMLVCWVVWVLNSFIFFTRKMKTYPFGVIFRSTSLTQLYLHRNPIKWSYQTCSCSTLIWLRETQKRFLLPKKTGCSEHGNENLFSLIHERKYIHVKSNQTR